MSAVYKAGFRPLVAHKHFPDLNKLWPQQSLGHIHTAIMATGPSSKQTLGLPKRDSDAS